MVGHLTHWTVPLFHTFCHIFIHIGWALWPHACSKRSEWEVHRSHLQVHHHCSGQHAQEGLCAQRFQAWKRDDGACSREIVVGSSFVCFAVIGSVVVWWLCGGVGCGWLNGGAYMYNVCALIWYNIWRCRRRKTHRCASSTSAWSARSRATLAAIVEQPFKVHSCIASVLYSTFAHSPPFFLQEPLVTSPLSPSCITHTPPKLISGRRGARCILCSRVCCPTTVMTTNKSPITSKFWVSPGAVTWQRWAVLVVVLASVWLENLCDLALCSLCLCLLAGSTLWRVWDGTASLLRPKI